MKIAYMIATTMPTLRSTLLTNPIVLPTLAFILGVSLSVVLLLSNILPLLTFLIGAGGIAVGAYSCAEPVATARIYGIPVQTTRCTLTDLLSPSASSTVQAVTSSNQPTASKYVSPTQRDLMHIRAHGIRDFGLGLTIVVMTWFWFQFIDGPSDDGSLVARWAARWALGAVLAMGWTTAMADAYLCAKAWEAAAEAAATDAELNWEAIGVARRATYLHWVRGIIWFMVGQWLIWGNKQPHEELKM